MKHSAVLAGLGLLLGCEVAPLSPAAPAAPPAANLFQDAEVRIDLSGRCYARSETTPPVTEDQIQQVEVVPAEIEPDGTVINPAVFRNEVVQLETTPAQFSEFEMVCPPDLTTNLTTNLQRALTARGLYSGPLNGIYDDATGVAVRQLQAADPDAPRDSSILAVDTAAGLGLVPLTSAQIDAL